MHVTHVHNVMHTCMHVCPCQVNPANGIANVDAPDPNLKPSSGDLEAGIGDGGNPAPKPGGNLKPQGHKDKLFQTLAKLEAGAAAGS